MSAAEKHVILCSQANSVGPAACMNIERALKDPALFFFGELLGTFCHSHFPHCQHFLVGDGVFCGGGLTDSSLLHLFGTPFLPQPFPTPPLDRQLFHPPPRRHPFLLFTTPPTTPPSPPTALAQIKSLANDSTHKKHFLLLELFAHGTYADYKQDMSKFPPSLHPSIIKKLKMLSVVTMAASNKHLDYSQLMERLDLGDVRELEDLLIECIYAGIVVGRLDQQSSQLKIERVSGRDPSDLDIVNMCQKLDHWGLTVDNMILQVDTTSKQAANEYDVAKMKKTALKGRCGGGGVCLWGGVVFGWRRGVIFLFVWGVGQDVVEWI